jgi:hypothetical protein
MNIEWPPSDREKAIAVQSATLSFATGLWAGLSLVPNAALSVPKTEDVRGIVEPAYLPVPSYLPLITFVILAVGTFAAYSVLRESPHDEDADLVEETDG